MRLSELVEEAARAQVAARREAGGQYWADEDEIEQLSCEAYERLTDAEDDADGLDRPFDEVVAGICADLGLSPDWTARLTATMAPPVSPAPRHAPLAAPPPGLGDPESYADPPPPGPAWAPIAAPPHPPP